MEKPYNRNLMDNSFFFILSSLLCSVQNFSERTVLMILLSLITIGTLYITQIKLIRVGIFILGLLVCLQWVGFLWFLPAAAGVLFLDEISYLETVSICFIVGAVVLIQGVEGIQLVLILLLSFYAIYLTENRKVNERLTQQYLALKDNSWEQKSQLETRNSELLFRPDSSIELEITKERNRIAHDIHDNVGHLLSSALIQLGAIRMVNQQSNLVKSLDQLKETIDQGMNNIRHSVHNTFQETSDFQQSLDFLLKNFSFCAVRVEGDPASIPSKFSQTLTMVIKEALSNVMKHSNAKEVRITFSELPAFYKCVISDNGRQVKSMGEKGIGLQGMQQRLNELSGQLHIVSKENSFTLNIILPREEPS